MMDPQEPHADLISATRTLIKISAVQLELVHIKGHQDKNILGPFTRDMTLNIEADQLTCTKLNLLHNWTTTIPHTVEPRSLLYRSTAHGKNFGNTIRDHINSLATKAYWENEES